MMGPGVVFVLCYALLIFPWAYFRHDDWLILGNAMLLENDWSNLWRPSLLFGPGREGVWFFRPFFKLITYLCFKVFHYHYAAWLTLTLLFTVGAAWCASRALIRVSAQPERGRWFVLVFFCMIPFHFSNLVWAGEGLMNCPQVFLLALSLWLFCEGTLAPASFRLRFSREALAVIAFILALGFKESGVFHVAFLFGLLFSTPAYRAVPLKQKARYFTPYVIVALIYLIVRLVGMPINGAYFPSFQWRTTLVPSLFLLGGLSLPFVVWVLALWAEKRSSDGLRRQLVYQLVPFVPFFGISVFPYLGHPFFSPAWLLLPGFFSLLAVTFTELPLPRWRNVVSFGVLAVAAIPVVFHLERIGWRHWKGAQQHFQKIVRELPDGRRLIIYNCDAPERPDNIFYRVIGHHEAIYHLGRLHGHASLDFHVIRCNQNARTIANVTGDPFAVRWKFPRFEVLSPQ